MNAVNYQTKDWWPCEIYFGVRNKTLTTHVSLSWPWRILRISYSYCIVNTRPGLTGMFEVVIQDSINSEIHRTSFWNLQWTPGGVPSRGVKGPRREVSRSFPSRAHVKNEWSYTSYLLHGAESFLRS